MGQRTAQRSWLVCLQLIVLACGWGGCDRGNDAIAAKAAALTQLNGWSINGWNTNGWNTNGWSTSGWMTTPAGQLTGAAFLTGLGAGDIAYNTFTMGYLVACALADGDGVSANVAGASFTWTGRFGLAPEWKSSDLSPTAQRWISACMAAHVNRIGRHISISLRGGSIAVENGEMLGMTWQEAAFLGNLFDGTGLSVCGGDDNPRAAARVLAVIGRDCGDGDCPEMTFLQQCSGACSSEASTDDHWVHCAGHDEVLTTFLFPNDARASYGLPARNY
jgi:hypothetical protein